MAINLITGHYGTDHITANDARATNRAIFGINPFRATYNYNSTGGGFTLGKTSVTGGYKMYINNGLLYWNGMFIRITTSDYSEIVESCEGYNVYLHYTKSSTVEYIEIVYTTGTYTNKPTFSDDTSGAYLKIGTFNNADGSSITNDIPVAVDFPDKVKMMNATAIGSSNTEAVLLLQKSLSNASSKTDTEATSSSLSEKFTNFEYVEIKIAGATGYKYFRFPSRWVAEQTSSSGWIEWAKWHQSDDEIYHFAVQVYPSSSANAALSIGKLVRFANNTFSAETTTRTMYVYGVGRINNA